MEINKKLNNLKDRLLHQDNWQKVVLTKQWASDAPSTAGVYALKENELMVYVGETGSLRGRMKDLLDTRNHTFRRSLGSKYFSEHIDYKKASNKIKFPDIIENLVNDYISKNLQVAFLEVDFGRKELEEFIVSSLSDSKLNKRSKRKQTGLEKSPLLTIGTIDGFDYLTNFTSGEDNKFLVEYLLIDDNGFCHRASPFLMPVGTVFEHEFGRYEVMEIARKANHIVLNCHRLDQDLELFNAAHKLKNQLN